MTAEDPADADADADAAADAGTAGPFTGPESQASLDQVLRRAAEARNSEHDSDD
jgi:hypothetical protein